MKWIAIATGGIVAGAFAAIMFVGLVGPGNPAHGRLISEQDFASPWPFTVPEGRLRCTKNSVTFEAGGSTYAINGTAQGRGFPRVDPIWKYDTTMEETYAKQKGITRAAAREAIGTVRVNIGPVINAGLALCDG